MPQGEVGDENAAEGAVSGEWTAPGGQSAEGRRAGPPSSSGTGPPWQPPGGEMPGSAETRGPAVAEPGPLPVHPMSLGDILDGAFKLLKASARPIVLVTLAFVAPVQLLAAYGQRRVLDVFTVFMDPTALDAMTGDEFAADPLLSGLAGIMSLVVLPFVAGAVSRIVADTYLGDGGRAAPALRAAGRRWWSLLVSWFLVHIAEFGVAIVGSVLFVVGLATDAPALMVIGGPVVLLGIVAALFIMPLFIATAPAIVIDDVGAVAGMRRSAALLRPRYWPNLGIGLLAGLIATFVSSALGFVPMVLSFFLGSSGWILLGVGGVVSNLVALPVVAIVATLQYFDGRIRHEGFDLQLMATGLERASTR